ncbi:phosphatidylserine decarboxylase [Clostridium fermenticellae]|uniref:Phosphatidylserine decarboxylase proenzyme n=1 Tax=Clostridium fermenticellae TaxID=2068654 RepID=A0A386H075_9CLOT|nr:phosphatidylserine decarboxylase [Clostridium fermenticellae]AYD39062.1 phosphatidylserine decarboxylase [Clostridium fermenticellae]
MITYYNRKTKKYEIENVAGDKYLNWVYSSPIGMNFLELFVKKKLFSKLYGYYCNSALSKHNINKFTKKFNIDMKESIKSVKDFTSFNDFFTRKLRSNSRPIDMNNNVLISPGDGRLTVYQDIDMDKIIQIKGFTYKLRDLIDDNNIASNFSNGTCLILRLCPTDYHRFHFIDNGVCNKTQRINGDYYSVNPIALKNIPELFCKNKREWTLFHSENFNDIICVEVGATCVGSIIQTYTPGKLIKKGQEKGYFKFGGSTTILFFKRNTIYIDKDIIENSKSGYESKVKMGEHIGSKIDNL